MVRVGTGATTEKSIKVLPHKKKHIMLKKISNIYNMYIHNIFKNAKYI